MTQCLISWPSSECHTFSDLAAYSAHQCSAHTHSATPPPSCPLGTQPLHNGELGAGGLGPAAFCCRRRSDCTEAAGSPG